MIAAMKARLLFVAALLLPLPLSAQAQVVVVGTGAAQSCYQSALRGNDGTRSAVRTCDRALEQDALARADRAATRVNRGVLLMRRGDHARAAADYRAALELYPALAEAHINHGVALYHQGDLVAAEAAYDAALALGSDQDALAHFNRALVHERTGDLRAAYDDLTRAAELAADWDLPRNALTRFTVRKRDS